MRTIFFRLFLLAILIQNFTTKSNAQLPIWLPKDGLVAWYPFSGNTLDSSGNENNGSVIGSLSYTYDHLNNSNSALLLGSGRVTTNSSMFNFSYDSSFTISFWVLDKGSSGGRLISTECPEGNFRISTYGNGVYTIQYGSSANYLYDTLQLNVWYHLAYVFDKRNVKLYKNGTLKTSNYNNDFELLNYCAPFTIGAKASPSYDNWNGAIDELTIHSKSLTENEILNIYNGQIRKSTGIIPSNGLIAWYPFTGNTLDSSGQNNNLTNNSISFVVDRLGNTNSSAFFNGSTSYANLIAKNILQPNSYTLSCWINSKDIPLKNYSSIITYSPNAWTWGPPYKLFLNSSGQIEGRQWSSSTSWQDVTTNTNYIVTNKWFHLLMTFDSLTSTQSLYINNQLINKRKSILSYSNNLLAGLFIGATRESADGSLVDFFSGNIDDIRIYNRALDNTEIQALYNEGGWNTLLPIQLQQFNATTLANSISLQWQTVTATNTDYFVVERSTNGLSFTSIGKVDALSSTPNYVFTDAQATLCTNFYRVKIVDKDGSSSYSKIVSAVLGSQAALNVYPNPAKDKVTLQFMPAVGKGSVVIRSLAGNTLYNAPIDLQAGKAIIPIHHLAKGIYAVQLIINHKTQVQTLVVE
jgi:Concanavalin A-like lectin/glucanases superfamily/Secretion system C-terminal sorting domain